MNEHESQSVHDRDLAAELRLRPERPPVTRLSRRVLIGLAAVAAIAVSGALIFALYQGQRKPTGGAELYNTDNKPTPDGLSTLPRDYTGVARNSLPPTGSGVPTLGPPLPGDLGRPIRNAQLAVSAPGEPAIDPEQQRITQETEAARTSRLFATTNARERPHAPIMPPASTSRSTKRRTGWTRRGAAARSGFGPEHAGPQARLPDGARRSQDRQPRSAWPTRHRGTSCRRALSFRRRSSPAFVPICRARSPPR